MDQVSADETMAVTCAPQETSVPLVAWVATMTVLAAVFLALVLVGLLFICICMRKPKKKKRLAISYVCYQ